MDNTNIIAALKDLIIRLQDAEKGYQEVKLATSNSSLKSYAKDYAAERHAMHKDLEQLVNLLGGQAEVSASFLVDLHRMFIDIKLSAIDDDLNAANVEIERGSQQLISDYNKVLDDLHLPNDIVAMLNEQKVKIINEVATLKKLAVAA